MRIICCKHFRGGYNHWGEKRNECTHKDRSKIIEGKEKAMIRDTKGPGYIKKIIYGIFGKPKAKLKRCVMNDFDKDDYCPLFESKMYGLKMRIEKEKNSKNKNIG